MYGARSASIEPESSAGEIQADAVAALPKRRHSSRLKSRFALKASCEHPSLACHRRDIHVAPEIALRALKASGEHPSLAVSPARHPCRN
jgi:hypothetical protein